MVQASYLALGGTNFIHYFNSTAMGSPDAAVPRQFPSGRKLAAGDILSCERSVDYWGYPGQILRSFFYGVEPAALEMARDVRRRDQEACGRIADHRSTRSKALKMRQLCNAG